MRLLLLFTFFLSLTSFANVCETYQGAILRTELCFDQKIGGWISKRCLKNASCDARKFFIKKPTVKVKPPVGGQNPAAGYCHALKLPVVVLSDEQGYEQSLCQFKDDSLLDSNAVERFLE